MALDKSKTNTYYNYILVFIPAIVYYFLLLRYAQDKPFYDDYDAVLQFLIDFKHASSGRRLALLFSMHENTENRILSGRLIYVAYYWLFGAVNFKCLILIGNAQLLAIYCIFIRLVKKMSPQQWVIPSLIFGCCIYDLNNFENSLWAMASVSNYGVILLFLATLLLYRSANAKLLPLAVLLQVITIYSNGNGMVASLVIVVFAVMTRDRIKIALSGATFAATTFLYFYSYKKTVIYSGSETSITQLVVYYFKLAGAHCASSHAIVPILFGILCSLGVLYFVVINIKNIKRIDFLFLFSVLLFAELTIGLIAVFRYHSMEYRSRYFIYPHLVAAMLFLLLYLKIEHLKMRKQIAMAATILMMVIYLENFRVAVPVFINRANVKHVHDPNDPITIKILNDARSEKVYYGKADL